MFKEFSKGVSTNDFIVYSIYYTTLVWLVNFLKTRADDDDNNTGKDVIIDVVLITSIPSYKWRITNRFLYFFRVLEPC